MTNLRTKEDLERLVQDKTEETLQLEFKGAQSLTMTEGNKREICKDVSAMANSAGGVIVYGILEKDHYAGSISPVKRVECSKERLDQVISSGIQPRIEGLVIHPIVLDNDNEVAYVVEVPKGNTAHMAKDNRYYKRSNFQAVAMEDYEVRDVMNRVKYPVINLGFEIVKRTETENNQPYVPSVIHGRETKVVRYYLRIRPWNDGPILAQYVQYAVEVPRGLLFDERESFMGSNKRQDVLGWAGGIAPKYGPTWFDPVLPQLAGPVMEYPLSDSYEREWRYSPAEVRWTSYADSAPPRTGAVALREIEFTVEDE